MTEPITDNGRADLGERHRSAEGLTERVRGLRLPRQVEAGSPGQAWLPWALSALLGCTSVLLGFLAFGRPTASASRPDPTVPAVGTTATAAPTAAPTATGDVVLESKGYIVPIHQIQVSPKISGTIIWLNPSFKEGARFAKGDELARIEDVDYRAARDHAQATRDLLAEKLRELQNGNRWQEKAQARADLAEVEANLKQYELDLTRSDRLVRGSALATKDYESAKYVHDATASKAARLRATVSLMEEGTREEKIKQAEADLKGGEADLRKAQWQLDNCSIKAPVTGTILKKSAEEGAIVNPIAFNISASLCDMADLTQIEVDMNIQERDIARAFTGQACRIRPEAYPDRAYTGWVSRLMPTADRAKGAVPVRVQVELPPGEEAGRYLRPEMSVLVSFTKEKHAS